MLSSADCDNSNSWSQCHHETGIQEEHWPELLPQLPEFECLWRLSTVQEDPNGDSEEDEDSELDEYSDSEGEVDDAYSDHTEDSVTV